MNNYYNVVTFCLMLSSMNIVIAQDESPNVFQRCVKAGSNIFKQSITPENKGYAKEKIAQVAGSAGNAILDFGRLTKSLIGHQMEQTFTPENKAYAKKKITRGVVSAGSAVSEFSESAQTKLGDMRESTQRIFHYLKSDLKDAFTGEASLGSSVNGEATDERVSQQFFSSINRYRLYVILAVSSLGIIAWHLYKKISASRKVVSEDLADSVLEDAKII